mmetsp:Transcript_7880/g.23360  ORF Transcript_7880/g.23360 Transcript_7880/m.23360 type:complete len:359 (+) Transcript_7880:799-1875(+)
MASRTSSAFPMDFSEARAAVRRTRAAARRSSRSSADLRSLSSMMSPAASPSFAAARSFSSPLSVRASATCSLALALRCSSFSSFLCGLSSSLESFTSTPYSMACSYASRSTFGPLACSSSSFSLAPICSTSSSTWVATSISSGASPASSASLRAARSFATLRLSAARWSSLREAIFRSSAASMARKLRISSAPRSTPLAKFTAFRSSLALGFSPRAARRSRATTLRFSSSRVSVASFSAKPVRPTLSPSLMASLSRSMSRPRIASLMTRRAAGFLASSMSLRVFSRISISSSAASPCRRAAWSSPRMKRSDALVIAARAAKSRSSFPSTISGHSRSSGSSPRARPSLMAARSSTSCSS